MRNTNERLDPLANGLAVQVGHAVFGDDKMDVITAGDDARALFEHRDNLAGGCTIFHDIGAGHGNYLDTALLTGSAIDKIELTADAAKKFGAYAVCTNLPGQVNFDG